MLGVVIPEETITGDQAGPTRSPHLVSVHLNPKTPQE